MLQCQCHNAIMAENFVAVQLPRPTYNRLKLVAEQTYRSVEDVLNSALNATLPPAENVSETVAAELAKMQFLSDDALFAALQSSFSPASQYRLVQLTNLSKAQSLTDAQQSELKHLLDENDLAVLRRTKAMAVLTQRGHDVLPDINLEI